MRSSAESDFTSAATKDKLNSEDEPVETTNMDQTEARSLVGMSFDSYFLNNDQGLPTMNFTDIDAFMPIATSQIDPSAPLVTRGPTPAAAAPAETGLVAGDSVASNSVPEFLYQLTRMLTDDNKKIIEWSNGTFKGCGFGLGFDVTLVMSPGKLTAFVSLARAVLYRYDRSTQSSKTRNRSTAQILSALQICLVSTATQLLWFSKTSG